MNNEEFPVKSFISAVASAVFDVQSNVSQNGAAESLSIMVGSISLASVARRKNALTVLTLSR